MDTVSLFSDFAKNDPFLANAYPAERIMRDCKIGEIGAGTTEVRKLILGRHFNALYKNN